MLKTKVCHCGKEFRFVKHKRGREKICCDKCRAIRSINYSKSYFRKYNQSNYADKIISQVEYLEEYRKDKEYW